MSIYNYTHNNSRPPPPPAPVKDYVLNYDYSGIIDDQSEFDDDLETFHLAEDGFSVQQSDCDPPKGYVFHKKHKSASSTLQTVMKNFGRFYAYPSEGPPIGSVAGGYPGIFQSEFLAAPRHLSPSSISVHQRMNSEVEKELFNDDAIFVSSVREPESFFRSVYQYFYQRWESENAVRNRKCGFVCWGMPFAAMLATNGTLKFGVSPNEFLDLLPTVFNEDTPWSFRAKNFQSFEFGLNNTRDDAEYIVEELAKLDKLYDFVAITEYYFESLVLLREMLCIPWHALYARSRMVSKTYDKIQFTPTQRKTLQDYFAQDTVIYSHFNQTLWRRIDKYGRSRMAHDAKKLKSMYATCNKQPKRCSYDRPPGIKLKKDDLVDSKPVNISNLLQYMRDNGGSCDWGAYSKLLNNVKTGCSQDKDYFP